jgi:hypothetical protein
MKRLLSAFCLLICLPVAAQDWELARQADERGDVTVYVKPVPGNPLKAFKGIIEVPQPMLSVMAVMGDIDRYPEWVFQCSGAEMRPDEWGKDVIRILIQGIWPVSDRDGVARSTISQDPESLAITIHSQAAKGVFPPQDGYVRLPDLDNTFLFEPLEDGWTRITFETFVDPGGYIPAWLANLVATRAPTYSLTQMSRLLTEERYALDSVDALPLEFPGVEQMIFPSLQ